MMTPVESFTLDLLRDALAAAGTRPEEVAGWWSRGRAGGEGFAEFLAREHVLTAEAPRTIPMLHKGYVRLDAKLLLAPTAAAKLSALRPAPPKSKPPASTRMIASDETPAPAFPLAPSASAGAKARVGQKFGRCLLTRVLGEGGGGVVYQALHQGLGVAVAVKVLKGELKAESVRTALRAEARVLAQLSHPNIVRVLDFDEDAPEPYLVMEFVEGFSLADLISQCGWLRPDHAAGLVAQAAVGLDAACQVGVYHRDVKPGNLLIGKGGRVKIADLGLAACVDARVAAETGAPDAAAGCRGGTVAYMAPERFAGGGTVDARSDIYSLGVTLFEAVTGRLPFEGENALEIMIGHANSPVPDVRDQNPAVPDAGAAVIARMMAKRPADRYDTYEALTADLAAAFGLAPEPAAYASWNSTRHPLTHALSTTHRSAVSKFGT